MTDSGPPARTAPRLMLCSCDGTMAPDGDRIGAATGLDCSRLHRELCGPEAGAVERALSDGPVIVACGQEAARFEALAGEMGAEDRLACLDIRDRAGWGEGDTVPKMAALLAGARVAAPPVPTMDVESAGVALVYGPAEVALPAAARLAPVLSVTAMVTDPEADLLPPEAEIDIVTGRIARLTGALGRFALTVDRFAPLSPAGRGVRGFGPLKDGASSECDIVLDLSGGRALVPAHHKRDGYLRAEPGDPLAVERALFDAVQLVGTFEKPLHIRFTESLCAHSRAQQTGCTRCLDVCPTSAISPNGDHVAIDPHVCAGCGACAAVCPSGASASDELPVETLFARMRVMATTYRDAGGGTPRLLVHDAHGAEMIRLAARHGRGLPADVIPLEVPALAAFGHAEMLAALALGYASVSILPAPRTERDVIEAQIDLAQAVTGGAGISGPRIALVDTADPDALMEALHDAAPAPLGIEPILAQGGRRETVRLAARALAGGVPEAPLPLPQGAPYGAVHVNTDKCTLCMACAGLCPTGALSDSPDRPQLSFTEEACIQCGLCAGLCPETAITLEPRLDLSDAAFRPRVANEEEPFECIECGKPFGVKSTIERITEKLSGNHAMFTHSDNVRLIQMCDDCRVRAQYHSENAPFRFGTVPRPRTTEDYRDEG